MKSIIAVMAACVLTAGCTVTRSELAANVAKPPSGARVLLVKPDVELGVLTALGDTEQRADWIQTATDNLQGLIQSAVQARSHALLPYDPAQRMEGRSGQILRLNAAVNQSIQTFTYGPIKLPTKGAAFDWTIGDGAVAMAEDSKADFALFVVCRGNYASGGRIAEMAAMSLLGVSIPLGQQFVEASLVDLHSGRVVWYNRAMAGPNADVRDQAGAKSLVTSLLKDAPL